MQPANNTSVRAVPVERLDLLRFVSFFCFGLVVGSMFNASSRASILMWFSAENADGVVTRAADPSNHNYLSYKYTVRGTTYTGTGYAPGHKSLFEGQTVTVYLFPLLPSNSVLADKGEQRKLATFGCVMGLLFGLFAGFGDYWKRRRSSAIGLRDTRTVR
jgi:hypothetical protein